MKYTCEAMRRMSAEEFHPYARTRKTSMNSTYSDTDSTSSSSPSSSFSSFSGTPPPYELPNQQIIYNRLKQYIAEVPKDPIVCQILLDSLSQVIELERQLAALEEKTHHLKMCQKTSLTPLQSKWHHVSNEKVPEDLANVDVSEFKHLVHSAPLVYDTISY